MGSTEGFFGGATVKEIDKFRFTQVATASACTSQVHKDEICSRSVSEQVVRDEMPDYEHSERSTQPYSFLNDDTSKESIYGNGDSTYSTLSLESKVILQKNGKIRRNNSGCTTRSRMYNMECSTNKLGLQDVNGTPRESASCHESCNNAENTQMTKPKNISNGRRGDKRIGKLHKNRCDSFSLKNGFIGFNSCFGGNNFLGTYGLKTDDFDITNHIDELSFDELLDDSFNCPITTKSKGKKAVNSNDHLLQSLRKACSVLNVQKVMQARKCGETDDRSNWQTSTGFESSDNGTCQTDGKKEDSCTANLPTFEKVKESPNKIEASIPIVDSPLFKPKDILERLALPPPKDLDSLLLEAAKPVSSSKNGTDPRLGKLVSQRTGLPPFPWSHTFSGHNKLGTDAAKLSTNRTTCHGRWVKVANSASSQKASAGFVLDWQSLSYNQSLVPSASPGSVPPDTEIVKLERILSAPDACLKSKVPPATNAQSTTHIDAAQMLYEMATHPSKQKACVTTKSLKRPSLTGMKACNMKSVEKSKQLFCPPNLVPKIDNLVKEDETLFVSRKFRLPKDSQMRSSTHTDVVRGESLYCSARRSSHTKLFKDLVAADSYSINPIKKPRLMPPPSDRERPNSSKQKLKKLHPAEWSKTGRGLE